MKTDESEQRQLRQAYLRFVELMVHSQHRSVLDTEERRLTRKPEIGETVPH